MHGTTFISWCLLGWMIAVMGLSLWSSVASAQLCIVRYTPSGCFVICP